MDLGFQARIKALAQDLLLGAMPLLFLLPLAIVFGTSGEVTGSVLAQFLVFFSIPIAVCGYYLGQFYNAAMGRQSAGRRRQKLVVVWNQGQEAGRAVPRTRLVWRSALSFLVSLPLVLFGLWPLLAIQSPVFALISGSGRSLCDLVCRTRLANEATLVEEVPPSEAA